MFFSLNQQFEKLVKTTLTETQMITGNSNDNINTDNNEETTVIDESARSPDFFKDNESI